MDPLAGLRDIHLPAAPGWWPPAPGWWLLAALAAVALLLVLRRQRRERARRRLLAHAERELERIAGESGDDPARLLAGVSALLRRVALRRHPRREVAGLTGQAWLEFLDRTGGEGVFGRDPARLLATGPYAPPRESHALDREALLAAARGWLARNL